MKAQSRGCMVRETYESRQKQTKNRGHHSIKKYSSTETPTTAFIFGVGVNLNLKVVSNQRRTRDKGNLQVYTRGNNRSHSIIVTTVVTTVVTVCVCVGLFSSHSFWTSSSLDVPAGVTLGGGHRFFHAPSFCGACLHFSREKDSTIPFPRRP